MAKYPKAFAERNKIAIAVTGLIAMVAVFLVAFKSDALPVIGGGSVHTAHFAESGGLREGDDVLVAGVEVGKVTDVSLDGATVIVRFRSEGVQLTEQTTAEVKIKTLLGQKYLALNPVGSEPLDGPIPKKHTVLPYDVNAALSDLSTTVEKIDTGQLEESLNVLTETFSDTPESVRKMLRGLTDLSRTISSRDTELKNLFEGLRELSGTVSNRNDEFSAIIQDASKLLDELERRRDAVKQMLEGTARLGKQVRGLVRDNEEQLKPALERLDRVAEILQRNQKHLEAAIEKLGPYYRVLASATGNGRWVDAYVCGLFNKKGAPLLKNDVKRNCDPGGGR